MSLLEVAWRGVVIASRRLSAPPRCAARRRATPAAGTNLVGPFGLVPTENTGKPSSQISRLSRTAASTMKRPAATRDIGEDRRLVLRGLLDDVSRNALEVADDVGA